MLLRVCVSVTASGYTGCFMSNSFLLDVFLINACIQKSIQLKTYVSFCFVLNTVHNTST